MAYHTPGPWYAPETNQVNYMGDTYTADIIYRRGSRDMVPLAFVVMGGNPDESVADTNLIASAPELLEALYAALPLVEDAARFMVNDFKPGYLAGVVRVVKNAIDKAEGRQ